MSAKLRVAWAEIGNELLEFLRKRAGGGESFSANAGLDLSGVVVTAAMKQWHTLRTLELIFQDVQSNQLNSRFETKWKEYQRRARWAEATLFNTGVGLVDEPIPRAEAPTLAVIAGATPGDSYLVQVAWTNSKGENGTPSFAASITVPTTGAIGVSTGGTPEGVTGFHVYAGGSSSAVTRQTSVPVAIGEQWVMPAEGLTAGAAPGEGQHPDWWLRNDRVLQRG